MSGIKYERLKVDAWWNGPNCFTFLSHVNDDYIEWLMLSQDGQDVLREYIDGKISYSVEAWNLMNKFDQEALKEMTDRLHSKYDWYWKLSPRKKK